jgi:hypothetical protein
MDRKSDASILKDGCEEHNIAMPARGARRNSGRRSGQGLQHALDVAERVGHSHPETIWWVKTP